MARQGQGFPCMNFSDGKTSPSMREKGNRKLFSALDPFELIHSWLRIIVLDFLYLKPPEIGGFMVDATLAFNFAHQVCKALKPILGKTAGTQCN